MSCQDNNPYLDGIDLRWVYQQEKTLNDTPLAEYSIYFCDCCSSRFSSLRKHKG